MEHLDIVIVGAGLHGLAVARTLVAANLGSNEPKKIVILEEGRSIGGTWAAERLYSGLKTNNVVGSYEFSDFPMDLERYGLTPGQHIPGSVVHRYFTDFARHFGLDRLIRYQTKVERALLRDDGTWELDCTRVCDNRPQSGKLTCDKLVIATGLTSDANMPTFPGSSDFLGPLFHAKDLHTRSQDLTGCEEVVVIGGNKSAWDVCYSVATSGSRAHMVIRRSGGGPSWVWRPMHLFTLKLTLARISSTRLFSWFDPSPFGSSFSSVRRFLQETILGVWLTWAFWTVLDLLAMATTGYNDTRLELLRPWVSTFWMGNSLSIHNYESDWFEFARKGQIVIHHADVVSLGGGTAQLSDGSNLRVDALVCCTGWNCTPPIKFEPEGISEEIGLPRKVKSYQKDLDGQRDQDLRSWVHAQIRARCAQLGFVPRRTLPEDGESQARHSLYPKFHSNKTIALDDSEAPYRLYRFIVPASPRFLKLRNIGFIGMHRSVHAVIVAQAQALWLAAFFEDGLREKLDSQVVYREAVLHTEYERLRRPRESGGSGASFPDLVFDSIPYTDLLLEDLGLEILRKRTLWENIVQPHLPVDYRGLVEEWRAEKGKKKV
ncbi:FAD/NAD(P)-binding domain-containing protein [Xylaria bambusicola]|uniref:FAD/NAD(P)-binding domain-containing protein n=1 Tax=Xylaria bambusicola TaxID=326684 RepID=UPI0020080C72|nr:FAD/NAD(P)-binding domain-containing protein [Xylaria bambusicola]KAI0526590.1 FAD/NAD(P)-binding domain-containing protein [Xylaria bambusicola]